MALALLHFLCYLFIIPELSLSAAQYITLYSSSNKIMTVKLTVGNNQIRMSKTHTCYFHKNKPITSFCTLPQCTLPMCQDCLPIHCQQHQDIHDQAAIIPFAKAEEKAISSLRMNLNTLTKNKKQCEQALNNTRDKLLQLVNTFFKEQQTVLTNMFASLQETDKKLNKIQKGSLKSLIYFFSSEEIKVEEIQRTALAYRQSLQEKAIKVRQNLSNNFTLSLFQVRKKQVEPQIPTMRELRTKSTNQRTHEIVHERSREVEPGSNRDIHKDRSSNREYQHKQIFSQKSTENLQLYSRKKYQEERPREFEPDIARNRISTQIDLKPSFKTEFDYEVRHREYQPIRPEGLIREDKRRTDFEGRQKNFSYTSKPDLARQDQWSKKPLLPSDLNLEYTNSVRINSSKGKDIKNRLELSKQVLSPEQIRKMLEKRIQERSRIISKAKNATPSRYEESGQEFDRNWETKDSIINQIYNDYRY